MSAVNGAAQTISTTTTLLTPPSGGRIRLTWLALATPETLATPFVATVKLGAETVYIWPLGAPGAFAHSSERIGPIDGALTVELSLPGTVHVNYEYTYGVA